MLRLITFLFLYSATSLLGGEGKSTSNPSFSLAAGVSASSEQCVVAAGSGVVLGSCTRAVAAGDGSDIWSFSDGQLVSAANSKCMTLLGGDATGGGRIGLADCDNAIKTAGSQWEVLGSGQLKAGIPGAYCLSQQGNTPGLINVAANAAVTASSAADTVAHGAFAAVDGNEASFWASKLGDAAVPVTLTIDLGTAARIAGVSVEWEFPAQAFAISTSADGVHFTEAFATDSNVLLSTSASIGGAAATKVKITMYRPHPTHGTFDGHSIYGIRSLAVYSPGMNAIVEECAKAAKSTDARDKYFQVYVGEFDPYAAKALASELPALEAARASVSATISELAEALPKMRACKGKSFVGAKLLASRSGRGDGATSNTGLAEGLDSKTVGSLIAEARATIMAARALLK